MKKIKTRNKVTQQRELKVRAKHYIEIKAIYIKENKTGNELDTDRGKNRETRLGHEREPASSNKKPRTRTIVPEALGNTELRTI